MKNSKILLIGLLVLGYIIHGNAQSKGEIAKNLSERAQNSKLTEYTNLLSTTTTFKASSVEKTVSNATVFDLDRDKALDIINQERDYISLDIQLNMQVCLHSIYTGKPRHFLSYLFLFLMVLYLI